MTDRRKFLQLLASACAVAACPKILLPPEATLETVVSTRCTPRQEPSTVTLAEWSALLAKVQEEHFRASRETFRPYERFVTHRKFRA
jgi:hypothetical protein